MAGIRPPDNAAPAALAESNWRCTPYTICSSFAICSHP